jgi:hypothetical protein
VGDVLDFSEIDGLQGDKWVVYSFCPDENAGFLSDTFISMCCSWGKKFCGHGRK